MLFSLSRLPFVELVALTLAQLNQPKTRPVTRAFGKVVKRHHVDIRFVATFKVRTGVAKGRNISSTSRTITRLNSCSIKCCG